MEYVEEAKVVEVVATDPSMKEIAVRAVLIPFIGVLTVTITTAIIEKIKARQATKKLSKVIEATATEK